MGIREQTRDYMAEKRIRREEMARRIGFPVSVFCKWLDRRQALLHNSRQT